MDILLVGKNWNCACGQNLYRLDPPPRFDLDGIEARMFNIQLRLVLKDGLTARMPRFRLDVQICIPIA